MRDCTVMMLITVYTSFYVDMALNRKFQTFKSCNAAVKAK